MLMKSEMWSKVGKQADGTIWSGNTSNSKKIVFPANNDDDNNNGYLIAIWGDFPLFEQSPSVANKTIWTIDEWEKPLS